MWVLWYACVVVCEGCGMHMWLCVSVVVCMCGGWWHVVASDGVVWLQVEERKDLI